MKYTLNQTGQAAIVKNLEAIGRKERPWLFFQAAEQAFNMGVSWSIAAEPAPYAVILDPCWFDTSPEPATFDEVVAMLRAVRIEFMPNEGGKRERIDALLARCPKD